MPQEELREDALSPGLNAYKRTPVFDESAVPPDLGREYWATDNLWALIHVLKGKFLCVSLAV